MDCLTTKCRLEFQGEDILLPILSSSYKLEFQMTLKDDTDKILDPLLRTFSANLETQVADQLAQTYISGTAEMVSWAGLPFEGPPMAEAIAYARAEAAQLVTEMDKVTKDRLANMIGDAIENKRGVPGLARDIHGEFGDMSRYRSRVIARTETADALTNASLNKMDDMGITGKEWVTVGDDRVSADCRANEGQGPIPVKKAFTSGKMGPPQHPSCRCAVAPVML